jgi:hypothetical protein
MNYSAVIPPTSRERLAKVLTPKQLVVMLLIYGEGLTQSEAASRLGVRAQTVQARWCAGLARLDLFGLRRPVLPSKPKLTFCDPSVLRVLAEKKVSHAGESASCSSV